MNAATSAYDVVTLGETMLRFSPPGLQRLEQATAYEIHVGGSESNTAVGLARLGLRVAWLSRLGENALGRIIAAEITRQGVDCQHICWAAGERVGTYFIENAPPPRGIQLLYDRAHSAMSRMQPQDLPAAVFAPGSGRLLHLTGITPALSETAAATCRRALQLARAAGWRISFDLNYRSKLWSAAEARAGCEYFLSHVDWLLLPLADVQLLFPELAGEEETPAAVLARLGERYPVATIVLTLSAAGSRARGSDGRQYAQAAIPQEGQWQARIGAGDAFNAGFLAAMLTEGEDLAEALRWGAAGAALKFTILGDMPLWQRAELLALLAEETSAVSR
ncbi:MAG: sugar kinase [Anaerolineaceae bacterium]|nr:sugar kinase [Anaerolineaceae bacterium]